MARSGSTLIHVAPVNSEESDQEVSSMSEAGEQGAGRAVEFAKDSTVYGNPHLQGAGR